MLPVELAKLILSYINFRYKLFMQLASIFNSIQNNNINYLDPKYTTRK